VGFADGDDRLFNEFKKVVHENHWENAVNASAVAPEVRFPKKVMINLNALPSCLKN
jgi:hypothetical protein